MCLRLLVLPAVVGCITGAAVGALSWLIDERGLGFFAAQSSLWIACLPLAVLPAAWLINRFITRAYSPSTSELYIEVYHDPEKRLPLRQTPGRYLAGAATVLFGGSQGLESPSTLLGTSTGSILERWFPRLFRSDFKGQLLTAGASAGIAAVFSSPGAGAMFGLEAPFRRGMDVKAFIPALVAAGCSYTTDVLVRGPTPLVASGRGDIDVTLVVTALVLALGCGIGARGVADAADRARQLARKSAPWQRIVFGSLPLAVLALLGFLATGAWVTFGPGNVMVDWALAEPRVIGVLALAAVLHTAGTITCVYGGGGGGVFRSLAAAGVMVGQIAAVAIGRPEATVLPLVGMACFLSAAYRIPLAGLFLIAEGTGSMPGAALGFVAIAIAQVCMGEQTIAPAQAESSFGKAG